MHIIGFEQRGIIMRKSYKKMVVSAICILMAGAVFNFGNVSAEETDLATPSPSAEATTAPEATGNPEETTAPDIIGQPEATQTPNVTENININELTFPDAKFREYVLDEADSDKDKMLSESERLAITYINIRGKEISDIKGIEYFENLTMLTMSSNNITKLDLSANTKVTHINAADNRITALNLNGLTELKSLNVSGNMLKDTIVLSEHKKLVYLNVADNKLRVLNILENEVLKEIDCSYNDIIAITLPASVEKVVCNNNNLYSFGLDNLTSLKELNISYNHLGAFDVPENVPLTDVTIVGNVREVYVDTEGKVYLADTGIDYTKMESLANASLKDTDADASVLVEDMNKIPEKITYLYNINENVKADITLIPITGKKIIPDYAEYVIYLDKDQKAAEFTVPYVLIGGESVVKWESSNVTVATVSEDGVITPVSAGTAIITVSAEGYTSAKYTLRISDGIEKTDIGNLPASAIPDQIYTGTELKPDVSIMDGNYKLVKDVDYTLAYSNNITAGTGIVTVTGKGNYTGSKLQSFNIIVPQVTDLIRTGNKKTQISLTWKAIEGVDGYRIYRYNPTTGKYAFLKQLPGSAANNYTDTGLVSGTEYRYRVRAYVTVNNEKKYGKYSVKYKTATRLKKETLKVKAGKKSASLSWKLLDGASGYELLMSKNGTDYSLIKTVTKKKTISYVKTGLKKNKKFFFKVRAYKTVAGEKIYGSYSKVKSIIAK